MRKLFAAKPEIVVVAPAAHQAAADKLVAGLKAKGIAATTKAPAEVLRKVAYPRVWNPFAHVYESMKAVRAEPGPVEHRVTVTSPADGVVVVDDSGKPAELRRPKTRVIVGAGGWLDWSGDHETAYLPGCLLYVDAINGTIVPLNAGMHEEKTTPEFRAKWARPWRTLTSHLGTHQLPAQLPEAYTTDSHLILLGDGSTNEVIAILQASEILPRIVDAKYRGPGKALVQFAWSPFRVGKNAIVVGGSDAAGLATGIDRLLEMRLTRGERVFGLAGFAPSMDHPFERPIVLGRVDKPLPLVTFARRRRQPIVTSRDANDEHADRDCSVDLPARRPKSERRPQSVPESEPRRHRDEAEQPQRPDRRAVPEHLAAIADPAERAAADVETVRDQAEAGEEAEHVDAAKPADRRQSPERQRHQHAADRPGPDDDERHGILGEVGSRDRQRIEHDPRDPAPGSQGAEDVAELVDRLHRQPGAEQRRADQDRLRQSRRHAAILCRQRLPMTPHGNRVCWRCSPDSV